jgi:hypothetical protein
MLEICSQTNWTSPVARKVQQLAPDGTVIATYLSTTIAARETRTNYTKLTEVARGMRQRSGGFGWRYLDEKNGKADD